MYGGLQAVARMMTKISVIVLELLL